MPCTEFSSMTVLNSLRLAQDVNAPLLGLTRGNSFLKQETPKKPAVLEDYDARMKWGQQKQLKIPNGQPLAASPCRKSICKNINQNESKMLQD